MCPLTTLQIPDIDTGCIEHLPHDYLRGSTTHEAISYDRYRIGGNNESICAPW